MASMTTSPLTLNRVTEVHVACTLLAPYALFCGGSLTLRKQLISVFEKMGEDPDAPGYLKPADDDVWAYMEKVQAWLIDAKRKGIPA